MRTDLGSYPTYLYDNNPFNDVKYVFDSKVFFSETMGKIIGAIKGEEAGITSFDNYSFWHWGYNYGINAVCGGHVEDAVRVEQHQLSKYDRENMIGNIQKNVIATPLKHPNITYCYFLTPYSALYWKQLIEAGEFEAHLEAERYVVEEIIKIPNIKLISLNDCFDITTNLNFYKDEMHYGKWINEFILHCIKDEKHFITTENSNAYIESIRDFYTNYDFSKMDEYEDLDYDNAAYDLLQELIKEGKA